MNNWIPDDTNSNRISVNNATRFEIYYFNFKFLTVLSLHSPFSLLPKTEYFILDLVFGFPRSDFDHGDSVTEKSTITLGGRLMKSVEEKGQDGYKGSRIFFYLRYKIALNTKYKRLREKGFLFRFS